MFYVKGTDKKKKFYVKGICAEFKLFFLHLNLEVYWELPKWDKLSGEPCKWLGDGIG